MKTVYALFVGINQYQGGVTALNGCVNDVKSVHQFLEARARSEQWDFKPLVLTSGDPDNPREIRPTRQKVIDSFRKHLTQAGPDDVALFYYSGHGSQEQAPREFWHLEPDHLNETLVCMDSRTDDGWDLADKELAGLIAEVAAKDPHILVVLDACHSGSGTRDLEGEGVRLASVDQRQRPLNTYLKSAQAARAVGSGPDLSKPQQGSDWFALPQGRHVVFAACRPEQKARERRMPDGQVHGLLTFFLLETLRQVGPALSYREVFSRVSALVRNAVTEQNPLLEASQTGDLDQPFLGGAVQPQEPYYSIEHQNANGWVLQAGAIQGIAGPAFDETTRLAVFPLGVAIRPGDKLSGALGFAQVEQVFGAWSKLSLDFAANPAETYKAVVAATPLPPVQVCLAGDDETALKAYRKLKPSLLVRETAERSAADLLLQADRSGEVYHLQRAGDLQALRVEVPKDDPQLVRIKLEHMAQWQQLLRLDNTQTRLPRDAVRMEVYRYNPKTKKGEKFSDLSQVSLPYNPQAGEEAACLQIRLVHTGKVSVPLFCMLVDLAEDFSVYSGQEMFGKGVWLQKKGDEAWTTSPNGEKYFETFIPDELVAQGVSRTTDVFKLIVSTDESDATLLQQAALEVVASARDLKDAGKPASTLDRLLRRFASRAARPAGAGDKLSDWYTTQATVSIERLGDGVAVPAAGKSASLADGALSVAGHPGLRGAKVALLPFGEGKRDLGNLALPAALRSLPGQVQPFELRPSRGGDAGSSVLVLSDVADTSAVNPQQPLVFSATGQSLGQGEYVLPVAFDPEAQVYLPLGIGFSGEDGVTIRIDRLTAPTGDSRSIGGTIKLFLQKVIGEKIDLEKFGLDDNTTRLAAFSLDANGQGVYDDSPLTLKEQVGKARRILLCLHGITGDTLRMATAAFGLQPHPAGLPKLADHYDLILTWDYENINTPIEETAAKLKQALAAAGLGPNHGKTLHILAHSLGTMVTRYFVERDSGARVVQKAVLAGPPNAGTPWAVVEDYVLLGLAAGINGLTALVAPPAAIVTMVSTLGAIVTGAEKIDTTMDQIKPGSSFYRVLNSSDDPNVPYFVIAGNTSKIVYPSAKSAAGERQTLADLAQRLVSEKTRNNLLSLAFFNHPNDMAVSMKSMTSLPEKRQPEPVMVEVAVDHTAYFVTEIGLRAVTQALLG